MVTQTMHTRTAHAHVARSDTRHRDARSSSDSRASQLVVEGLAGGRRGADLASVAQRLAREREALNDRERSRRGANDLLDGVRVGLRVEVEDLELADERQDLLVA